MSRIYSPRSLVLTTFALLAQCLRSVPLTYSLPTLGLIYSMISLMIGYIKFYDLSVFYDPPMSIYH